MRVPSLVTVLLIAASVVVAGCGGPTDSNKALSAACKRQIEQINEETHESSTPTAKSTDERLANVTLQHCAGQNVVLATPEQLAGGGDAKDTDKGADKGATEDEGTDTGEDKGDTTDDSGKDEGDAGTDDAAELDPAARELFQQSCGSCHALADAEATGAVGPDLDAVALDAETIDNQIVNGGGAMPPGLLKGEDATKVAEYVAAASKAAG